MMHKIRFGFFYSDNRVNRNYIKLGAKCIKIPIKRLKFAFKSYKPVIGVFKLIVVVFFRVISKDGICNTENGMEYYGFRTEL